LDQFLHLNNVSPKLYHEYLKLEISFSPGSVGICGPSGSGKTSIAAQLALESEFPYVKIISPTQFVGIPESIKMREISKVFEDSYKSPLSLIVVDNIDRLIEYVPVGPRFSANILQTLLVLCNNPPSHPDRRLMVIATTSNMRMIEELGFHEVFMNEIEVAPLDQKEQVEKILELLQVECPGGDRELKAIASACVAEGGDGVLADCIPIKRLLAVIDTCKLSGQVNLSSFKDALRRANKTPSFLIEK